MSDLDPFPSTEFDSWAQTYDQDVNTQNKFPFDGYERVLDTVLKLAAPERGMSVLDLGTGTANLAVRFAPSGSELWCSDFSQTMLDRARLKMPSAHFILHDLRAPWPPELNRRFDRIVSAYVFHHFDLEKKVGLCAELCARNLSANGNLIIADLSFPDRNQMGIFARSVGDLWEEEPYWLVDEVMPKLRNKKLKVGYEQVAACAGIYSMRT
jgi:putative AdoMet-dependent methyltransferase